MNLTKKDIRLGQEISNKEEAIRRAGEILVESGYVDSDYIPAMLEREEIVSTYMGSFK
jgi:PTS system mannitol-specific EIICBA component